MEFDYDAYEFLPTTSEETRQAIRNTLGSLRLSGMHPDAETVRDVERAIAGEITFDAVVELFKQRFAAGTAR